MKKVAMASDHAGYELKETIKKYMQEKGYEVVDFGTDSEASCDYADYAHPCAAAVENGECDFGIAMCGSGNGINMTLNKHQGIRAALCWIPEIASLAKSDTTTRTYSLCLPVSSASKRPTASPTPTLPRNSKGDATNAASRRFLLI